MNAKANPPRLLHDPEIGEVFRRAIDDSWSGERIAQNGEAIGRAITGPAISAGSGSITPGAGVAGTVKGTVVLIAVGAVAIGWMTGGVEAPSRTELVSQRVGNLPVEQRSWVQPVREVSTGAGLARAPAYPVRKRRASIVKGLATPSAPVVRESQPPPQRPPQPQTAPRSLLVEQLEQLSHARALAADGNFEQALVVLKRIQTKYPQSPLEPDIALARVEYLVAGKRVPEALILIESLLPERRFAAKRAQLLRLQGDLFVSTGDCSRATAVYQRALGLGLYADEAEAARAGLRNCARP